MKKWLVFIFALVISFNMVAQTKKPAVDFSTLVGKSYKSEKELLLLDGYTNRGGSMLTNVTDSETLVASWFNKGSIAVVLFERVLEDNTNEILDVLTVTNVGKNQEIKIGDCREGDTDMIEVVALVTTTNAERVKAIKAWRFNRDKLRIETMAATQVTCLGMVGED